MNYNGTEYYYVTNMQGDVIKLIDVNGVVKAEYKYDAWGNVIYKTGSLADINPYRYRGYRYDEELGLYYLQSRYYNPETHRFISADGLLGEQGDPLGHNMYAYCQNNPVMYSDISGYLSEKTIKNITFACIAVSLVALTVVTFGTGAMLAGIAYGSISAGAQIYSNYKNDVQDKGSGVLGAFIGGYISGAVPGLGGALASGFASAGVNFIENQIYERNDLKSNLIAFGTETIGYTLSNVVMNVGGRAGYETRLLFAVGTDFGSFRMIDYVNNVIRGNETWDYNKFVGGW